MRLVRICSNQSDLKKRLDELKDMLLSRRYNKNIIKETARKALDWNRVDIL
jgi:hypothetical protein